MLRLFKRDTVSVGQILISVVELCYSLTSQAEAEVHFYFAFKYPAGLVTPSSFQNNIVVNERVAEDLF